MVATKCNLRQSMTGWSIVLDGIGLGEILQRTMIIPMTLFNSPLDAM